MRLDFLTLADKAEAINGKLYMMGGGVGGIGLIQLPGPAAVDVAIGLMVDYAETSDTHQLQLSLETADNTPVIGPITIPFATGRPPGLPAGEAVRFIAVLQGPFPIPGEGRYHWVAQVGDVRFPPTIFQVIKMTPLVAQPPG
jgi:hypothetical protein